MEGGGGGGDGGSGNAMLAVVVMRGGKFECTLRAAVVFVMMHKTIMGATHFFWWGIGGCHGLGKLENAINPYMANYVEICGSMN